MTSEECVAVGKLEEWMAEDTERTQAFLASKCGVKPPSVHAWLARHTRPVAYLREVIEVLTDGHVRFADWDLPSECEKRDEAIRLIRSEAEDELSGDAA